MAKRSGEKGQHKVRPFTHAEYNRIMRILQKRVEDSRDDPIRYYEARRNYMILYVGVNVGLRQSDLMRLTPDSLADGTISYTAKKTGKSDAYDLDKDLYKVIREYIKEFKIKDNEYLFRGLSNDRKHIRSTHLSQKGLMKIIKKVSKEASIKHPVGTHSLRKSYAMWLYEKCGSMPDVQQALQHSSVETTMAYLGISSETLQRLRRHINFKPEEGKRKVKKQGTL